MFSAGVFDHDDVSTSELASWVFDPQRRQHPLSKCSTWLVRLGQFVVRDIIADIYDLPSSNGDNGSAVRVVVTWARAIAAKGATALADTREIEREFARGAPTVMAL